MRLTLEAGDHLSWVGDGLLVMTLARAVPRTNGGIFSNPAMLEVAKRRDPALVPEDSTCMRCPHSNGDATWSRVVSVYP